MQALKPRNGSQKGMQPSQKKINGQQAALYSRGQQASTAPRLKIAEMLTECQQQFQLLSTACNLRKFSTKTSLFKLLSLPKKYSKLNWTFKLAFRKYFYRLSHAAHHVTKR